MKTWQLAALACLAFVGCTHTITLYPRGGGPQATGEVNDGSRNMRVELGGDTFTGSYILGQTFGVGTAFAGGTVVPVTAVGTTNQASALLVSPKGATLRCDFRIVAARGGNGVCVDGNNVLYDMLIK